MILCHASLIIEEGLLMKIQVLCGMIASGKSTYSKNATKAGALCVNDDAIVNMLHADQYTLYNKELKLLYKSIENHAISNGLALGRTIIIDRGLNISIRGRKRWIALAQSFDVPCEAIIFQNEGPIAHAQRRSLSDARGHSYEYWLNVANDHNDIFVEPSLDEGFDFIHYITFDEIKKGKVF